MPPGLSHALGRSSGGLGLSRMLITISASCLLRRSTSLKLLSQGPALGLLNRLTD